MTKTAIFSSELGPQAGSDLPWHNFGVPYYRSGVYEDQLGIVHLKGLLTAPFVRFPNTPNFSSIFRLPPAYAPSSTRVFPTVRRNNNGADIAPGRVDVQPDGLVRFEQDCGSPGVDCSADGEYVTLDAISFRRDG